jgi:hypothetical protein
LYVFIARFVPLAPVIPIISIPIVMQIVMISGRSSLLTARSVVLMFAPPIHSLQICQSMCKKKKRLREKAPEMSPLADEAA